MTRRVGSLERRLDVVRVARFLVFAGAVSLVLLTAVGASGSGSKSAAAIPAFAASELSAPSGTNWISEDGNVQSWRYSTLSQITASNGGSLKLAWTTHLTDPATIEKNVAAAEMPLAYNGVVYTQDAWWRVTAVDGASGKILWQFDPQISLDQGGGSSSGGTARSIGMGGGISSRPPTGRSMG
jgi:glucose dehydrogenase